MTATPPPSPSLRAPSPRGGSSGPSLLLIAGGVLIASSLLTIGLALYGERSVQPEALLQKLFTFVSQFPTLLLGFSLVFFGRERLADRAGWNWSLLRLVPLLLLLLYLAAIPSAGVLLQGLKDRLDTRLQNVLQAGRTRGAQIEADLVKLDSTPAILAALRTYPEISNIDLPTGASPDQVRTEVGTAISKGLEAQKTQGRQEIAGVVKAQGALVRTIMANAALASVGFLLVSARLLPWVDNVTRLLTGAVTGAVAFAQSLLRTSQRDMQRALNKPAAPSNRPPKPVRRGPGMGERLAKDLGGLESGMGKLFGRRGRPKGGQRR
jgi:hypothetical protein